MTREARLLSGGVCDLRLHMVWCPRYCRAVLGGWVDELARERADERGWEVIALEVMPDQVHLSVKHDPRASTASFATSVGAVSAGTVRRDIDVQRERLWRK